MGRDAVSEARPRDSAASVAGGFVAVVAADGVDRVVGDRAGSAVGFGEVVGRHRAAAESGHRADSRRLVQHGVGGDVGDAARTGGALDRQVSRSASAGGHGHAAGGSRASPHTDRPADTGCEPRARGAQSAFSANRDGEFSGGVVACGQVAQPHESFAARSRVADGWAVARLVLGRLESLAAARRSEKAIVGRAALVGRRCDEVCRV